MAYKKFKLNDVEEKLGVKSDTLSFLPNSLTPFKVSDLLKQILADNEGEPLGIEKVKSELIISPVLKELRRQNPDKFTYFSGYEFNVDTKLELKGFCDFIISAVPNTPNY